MAFAQESPVELPTTQVKAEQTQGYKVDEMSSPKFTQPLQDIPQTIQVISNKVFTEQGAVTLSEALRNSPGVGTFYVGENGSSTTGDAIYMRGFDTSSSLFVDGVRDLGSISRDIFNTEQVEIIKGPAGTDNGRSAPSGSINMVSKRANLNNTASTSVLGGVDGQKRATVDINRAIEGLDGAAMRVNMMWQDSDVAGREHVVDKRWGIAPSFAFGLNSDTHYYLNLLHIDQDNVPDGRVPTIGISGWEPQEGLEGLIGHPVDPENFYGTRSDHDDVEANMATLIIEHRFSDQIQLTNTARWGQTKQNYLLTAFMATNSRISFTDPDDLSTYTMARGNPTFKDQKNTIITDQLNLRADFSTGKIKHSLSTGVEFTQEKQSSTGQSATNGSAWPDASLYNPDWNVTGLTWGPNGSNSDGKTDTQSIYAFDTLSIGDFLVTGGLRADHYKTEYGSTVACGGSGRRAVPCPDGVEAGTVIENVNADASDTLLTYKLGAVYKVGDLVSLYANYSLSQQPPGGDNFALSDSLSSADNPNFDPQEAKTAEIGSKWALLDGALALDVSVFETTVSNEVNSNDLDDAGNPSQTGEKTVKGFEISMLGNITDNWSITAGYSQNDTEVTNGPTVSVDGSNNLTYTPDYSFTSWTTYSFPFGLSIGGGVRVMDGLHRGNDGAAGTPQTTKSYTVLDANITYQVNEDFSLRLNAYNLTDKEYVAAINKSGYRYTPGTPATYTLTATYNF